MARKKLSERIVERLEALGYEVVDHPKPNAFWRSWGWRSAGTSCWYTRIQFRDENGAVILNNDLYCYHPMAEMLRVEKWTVTWSSARGDYDLYPVYPEKKPLMKRSFRMI